MHILYLVSRQTFLKKMSRVRFHGMEALGHLVHVHWSGIGWPDYDASLTVQENIDLMHTPFDLVIVYKPLELKNFKEISLPKCIRYNEMYNVPWTLKEIKESGCQLVICHHLNDCKRYQALKIPNVRFVYIGHCAKRSIFKNYHLPIQYDITLLGCLCTHYPLRLRFLKLLPQLQKKYRCTIHPHPGYDLEDAHTDRYLIDMARVICQSRIVLTDTGIPRSRFGKYIEIPMCGCAALCGDLPQDVADNYSYVINVNQDMTDHQILTIITTHLDHITLLHEKVLKGVKFATQYTQKHYAHRLLQKITLWLGQERKQDLIEDEAIPLKSMLN